MPAVVYSLDEDHESVSVGRRFPLTWHKLRRKMIQKLLRTIQVIRRSDAKTDLANGLNNVNNPMFVGSYGSGSDRALKTIENACAAALTSRG